MAPSVAARWPVVGENNIPNASPTDLMKTQIALCASIEEYAESNSKRKANAGYMKALCHSLRTLAEQVLHLNTSNDSLREDVLDRFHEQNKEMQVIKDICYSLKIGLVDSAIAQSSQATSGY